MRAPETSVVIDTNVWSSGLIRLAGTQAQLTREVIRNSQPVFSTATFDELKDRLWRPKFDRYVSMEQRNALLSDLAAVGRWVSITRRWPAGRSAAIRRTTSSFTQHWRRNPPG